MARNCTVCAHPNRSTIDRELLSERDALRVMAVRWSVSKDALARHRSHVAASITKAKEREEVEHGDDLVQQLRDLKDEARALGAAAKTAGDVRTALVAIDKLTRLVELQARMVGELRDRELTVNVGIAVEHTTPDERRRDMRIVLEEIRRDAPELLVEAVAPAARAARRVRGRAMSVLGRISQVFAIRAARSAADAFAAFVLRDTFTGRPVVNAAAHVEMQRLISTCLRLAIIAPPNVGKSEQLIARIVWELGRDPSTTILLASASMASASKLLDAVATLIEHSAEVRAVFPHLRVVEKSGPTLRVAGAPSLQKDASVVATAPDAQASAQGFRAKLAILDDADTRLTARTVDSRAAMRAWYIGFVQGRLAPDARVVVAANAHHVDDLAHSLGKLDGWTLMKWPLVTGDGAITFPTWTAQRIDERRREVGPVEWTRTYLCDPSLADESPFFLAVAVDAALARGAALPTYFASGPHETAHVVAVGVDPAFTVSRSSDYTGLACAALHANGARELLEVRKIKARLAGIVGAVFDLCGRCGARVLFVESNSGGSYLVDEISRQAPKLRVVPTVTTSTTRETRIAALGAELDRAAWIFPNRPTDHAVRELARVMVAFRGGEHLPDDLSALLIVAEALRAEAARPKAQILHLIRGPDGLRFQQRR